MGALAQGPSLPFAVGIAVAASVGWGYLPTQEPDAKSIQLQELVAGIDDGSVARVRPADAGRDGPGDPQGRDEAESYPCRSDVGWIAHRALDRGVAVTYAGPPGTGILDLLLSLVSLAMPIGFLYVMSQMMSGAGGGSIWTWVRARDVDTRFADVAGADDAKEAMEDVVAFLRDPSAFEAVGARARCGVLMTGDPGNGKTLLARATAGRRASGSCP